MRADDFSYGLNEDKPMGIILPFLQVPAAAFDDEATHIIGEAFEAACFLLGNVSDLARETVAAGIIDAATAGERDPIRLRDAGMSVLGEASILRSP